MTKLRGEPILLPDFLLLFSPVGTGRHEKKKKWFNRKICLSCFFSSLLFFGVSDRRRAGRRSGGKTSQHRDGKNKPEINPNIGVCEPGGLQMERGDGGLQVLGPP